MPTDETPKTALIIGASRGLGLGLSLELLKRGWHVSATVRSAAGGTGLEAFHEQVTMDTLDMNDLTSLSHFVERMADQSFDVIFINAAVGEPANKTVETATPEDIAHLMMTNVIAPVRLAQKLFPMVKPASGILAFMTSRLGSVELNADGGMPLYSASKAALNRLTRSFVSTHPDSGITVLNIHPGWVRTDMGGPNASLDVETSVTGIANVLEAQAGAGGHHFLDYTGETLPW
jgi:NAD(P)-dependent dehydrogenase (short-subunit alcohol dehydrogenase family)